jgi:hypothetical protein
LRHLALVVLRDLRAGRVAGDQRHRGAAKEKSRSHTVGVSHVAVFL